MTDLEIKISVRLTAAQIKLSNSAIDNVEAEALASELHAIIAAYHQLFSVRPPGDLGEHASEEANMALTLWCTAMGVRVDLPGTGDSSWMHDRFKEIGDDDMLFTRWGRVSERISGGFEKFVDDYGLASLLGDLLVVCHEKADRLPPDAETWLERAEVFSRAIDEIGDVD